MLGFKTYSHELSKLIMWEDSQKGAYTIRRSIMIEEEILLPLFEQLTVQQACMLTGAL